jgi:hypothetical protein
VVVTNSELTRFVRESLCIEGILREPSVREVVATRWFLEQERPSVTDLERLVAVYAPGHRLRDMPGMNIGVGDHRAPPGGPEIRAQLARLLTGIEEADPWGTHVAYEKLHPFTDGNGRSGRALWAWQMIRRQVGLPLGFLHQWYYDTLAREDAARPAAGGAPMTAPLPAAVVERCSWQAAYADALQRGFSGGPGTCLEADHRAREFAPATIAALAEFLAIIEERDKWLAANICDRLAETEDDVDAAAPPLAELLAGRRDDQP